MSYQYRPALPRHKSAPGMLLLKVVGVFLALIGMVLAVVGTISFLHLNVVGLIFSLLVVLFGLRVCVLWLGATRQHAKAPRQAIFPRTPGEPKALLHPKPAAPPQPVSYLSYEQQVTIVPAAYPASLPEPAYPSRSRYMQPPPDPGDELRQPQGSSRSLAYTPIDQDALFKLDWPDADERCFLLPKEGELMVECQDRYALHSKNRCYAVTDGVAGSFVPGPWARIIARRFVEHGGRFTDREEFQRWLVECSQAWHTWMERRWVPTMNALREHNGDTPGEWSNDIRSGAQTTLIGCSLFPSANPQDRSTRINIFAIGDGEFFLFSPNGKSEWKIVEAFPFSDPHEFGSRPDTLVTIPRLDLLERSWMQRKTKLISASPGDMIVMASDTLAKWLLTEVQQRSDKWVPLLTCTSADEFEQRVRQEFHSNQMEDDDLTMLIIPIS